MLRSVAVGAFFHDLLNPDYETAFAIYHRRFSTNTTPKWPLAQPMRLLGHNGEHGISSSTVLFNDAQAVCFTHRVVLTIANQHSASYKLDSYSNISCHPTAGEINTLQGNLNWVTSREHELEHPIWKGREGELTPLCNPAESDSANLDHVAELLVRMCLTQHMRMQGT